MLQLLSVLFCRRFCSNHYQRHVCASKDSPGRRGVYLRDAHLGCASCLPLPKLVQEELRIERSRLKSRNCNAPEGLRRTCYESCIGAHGLVSRLSSYDWEGARLAVANYG